LPVCVHMLTAAACIRLLLQKPEDWPEVPAKLADPAASKPEDWDDEEDGEWEAPLIDNPAYKGEWKAKTIPNPGYKGAWVAPDIAKILQESGVEVEGAGETGTDEYYDQL